MSAVFLIIYTLGASGINIQADSNEYFYDYLEKHVYYTILRGLQISNCGSDFL